MLKKTLLLLVLLFILSCKRETYLPKDNNAFLASLKFSEGLALEEEFDKERFAYSLKVSSSIKGFFVICVTDNPLSKYAIYLQGLELPSPYVPLSSFLSNYTIKILVTSPDGTIQTYTIEVAVS